MKKFLIIISVLLNLMFIIYESRRAYYKYYVLKKNIELPIFKQPDTISYSYHKDVFYKMLPNDSNEVVFIGDSHTAGFPLGEMFKDLHIKNRGISADVTKGIYLRLDEAIESKPKKVFIQIGINDIYLNYPLDTTLKYYIRILADIKYKSPKSIIYVQNVIPVSELTDKKDSSIFKLNSAIYALSVKEEVNFIDLYARFVKNNYINPEYVLEDGVHLNGKGYFLWKEILSPYL